MFKPISRAFVSLLTTIVVLLTTHTWWNPVGVIVSLECHVEKDTPFQIFYLTKKDEKWGKNYTKKYVVSDNDTYVSFFLPCKKLQRLRIDTGEKPGRITINKVDVVGLSQSISLNLHRIKYFNYDSIEKSQNVISAVSKHRDPFIVFIDTLEVNGACCQLQWNNLITIIFIVGIGSYLVLSYFAYQKKTETSSKRDFSLDFLRALGLCLIILAHIPPPSEVFQIRTFDVPLMIFVSGMAYSGRHISNVSSFYGKRTLRIIVPAYIHLIVFLFILKQGASDWSSIINNFVFLAGPGYTWIFRIFLLMMLITPICLKLTNWANQSRNKQLGLCLFIVALVVMQNECLWCIEPTGVLEKYVMPYIIGYGVIYLMGVYLRFASLNLRLLFLVALGACLAWQLYNAGNFVPQATKYPPHGLFLTYGAICSIILFSVCKKIFCSRRLPMWCTDFVAYISSRTMWIYIWHVYLIVFLPLSGHWVIRYIIVFGVSFILTVLQNKLVDVLESKIESIRKLGVLKYLKS